MAVFTPTSADGTSTFAAVKINLAPQQVVALNDIVGQVMLSSGTGQLELLGASQILAMSRTYTKSVTGTYGQFVPSADPSEAVGSAVSLPGLENDAAFRTNIGFAEVSGTSAEVHVHFSDANGAAIGDSVYGLAPFSHAQTPMTVQGDAIRADVSVVGAGRVLAYASVVDNLSGDAMFIPAARQRSGYIPVIHSPGANGTLWRTDIWLTHLGGGTTVLRDFLHTDGRTFTSAGDASTLFTSRTYTVGNNGTFGQFVPPAALSTATATLVGIENDSLFRTNIGLIAPSPAIVRVTAFDAAGNDVWHSDVVAEGLTQFPLPVTLPIGRVTAEVLSGNGVVPYASVVDNQSGDPIFIVARY